MSEFQLSQGIIALSVANSWDEAKLEWELAEIYREDDPDTCLCSHYPINEICVLRNTHNGNTAIVGNVCVKKFLGLPSDKIFVAIKKISEDDCNALNVEAIVHAHQRGWVSDWDRKFYIDTWRKRNLSVKQMNKRIQINQKVLNKVTNKFRQR
jgi:hypothetical protein